MEANFQRKVTVIRRAYCSLLWEFSNDNSFGTINDFEHISEISLFISSAQTFPSILWTTICQVRSRVTNAFSTRLKLIWSRSGLKSTRMSKNTILAKSSRCQWVNYSWEQFIETKAFKLTLSEKWWTRYLTLNKVHVTVLITVLSPFSARVISFSSFASDLDSWYKKPLVNVNKFHYSVR